MSYVTFTIDTTSDNLVSVDNSSDINNLKMWIVSAKLIRKTYTSLLEKNKLLAKNYFADVLPMIIGLFDSDDDDSYFKLLLEMEDRELVDFINNLAKENHGIENGSNS